jgi:hypothetical protein
MYCLEEFTTPMRVERSKSSRITGYRGNSKMNRLQKLTWKYFLQQKAHEIGIGILVIFLLTLFPYFIGLIIQNNFPKFFNIEYSTPTQTIWFYGIMVLTLLGGVLFIFGILIVGISGWLKRNWKKAKKRAMQDGEK